MGQRGDKRFHLLVVDSGTGVIHRRQSGSDHQAVEIALHGDIAEISAGVVDALKIELKKIEDRISEIGVAGPRTAAGTDDMPMFIPSSVGQGVKEGSVKTTSKKSAGVGDALKALKSKKGKKK
jgi:hypothetical protein